MDVAFDMRHMPANERRQHTRFGQQDTSTTAQGLGCRLVCRSARGVSTAPVRDLSLGGIRFAAPTGFERDEIVDVQIRPPDDAPDIRGKGRVIACDHNGTRLAFTELGAEARQALQRLIQTAVITPLEYTLGGSADDSAAIVQLALWHRDLGRALEGLELFRAARGEQRPLFFWTSLAAYFMQYGREHAADREQVISEIQDAIARGKALGSSPVLDAIASELQGPSLPAPSAQPPDQAPATTADAQPGEDIEALKQSIEQNRVKLYHEFANLISERKRLESLVGGKAPTPFEDIPTPTAVVAREVTTARKSPATKAEAAEPPRRRVGLYVAALGLIAGGAALVYGLTARPLTMAPPAAPRVEAVISPAIQVPPVESAPAPTDAVAQVPATPTEVALPTPEVAVDSAVASDDSAPNAVLGKHKRKLVRRAETKQEKLVAPPPPPPAPAPRSAAQVAIQNALGLLQERKVLLAIEQLEKARNLEPNNADPYRLLGVAYAALGKDASAVAALEKFVALAPKHADAAKARDYIASHKR